MGRRRRGLVLGLAGLAGFLLIWELASRTGLLDAQYVPPPTVVASRTVRLFGDPEFVADFVGTVLAWLISLVAGTVVAVPLGLLLGSVPALAEASSVAVEFLRPVPVVALIPPVSIALGDGAQTKIVLAAFAAIWPVLFNVMYGLHEIDPLFVDTAQAFGTGRLRIALRVRLPQVMPFALTGIRLAAALTLVVVLSTELVTSSGLGFGTYVATNGEDSGDIQLVIVGVVLAGILGCLMNGLLVAVQNRWFGWASEGEG